MTKPKSVSIEEALNSLHRRPGIVLGPDATRAPGDLARVLVTAIKTCKIGGAISALQDSDCRSLIDKLKLEFPAQIELLDAEFRDGIRKIPPSLDINHLAKAGWSACVSLAEDMSFEIALRTHLDSVPGTRTLTIIDRLGIDPPQRTISVYKLLGNVQAADVESRLALSEADLLMRQQDWRLLLQSFPDFVQEAPVFLIGVTSCVSLTRQVLSALSTMPKPRPTKLFFLQNEGALSDPTIASLCDRFETMVIDGSLRDLCEQIAALKAPDVSSEKTVAKTQSSIEQLVRKHSGIVSFVPNEVLPSQSTGIDMPALMDGLFRPASQNWQPFQEKLDIRRAVTDELLASLAALQGRATPGYPRSFLVRGEAGVGKTTLLKRIAVELAQKGVIALWCSRTAGGSWLRAFKSLAGDLIEWTKGQENKNLQFAVVCDDPWALRIDAGDLISCFDRFPASLIFIFSVRNSDNVTGGTGNALSAVIPDDGLEVPFELVDKEMSQLGAMLVRIGASKDIASAELEVKRIPSHHAKDILCSLWYMVPETRTQLAESLRDEYCRLGSIKDAVSSMAESAVSHSGSIAHSAYEFVTVTSNLNIGLPVEVLVHALGVNYDEWLATVGHGRPLWGLLYDVVDERDETILYFTRNEVVTRVLLELVNGGVGHAGEMRILKRLLSACHLGSLVYRTFVLDVLVRGRKKLADVLTYEQGMELFDIARESLPFEDRVIEHHKGIWMQDVGHKDEEAYRQFEHALVTEIYPGADRDAPKEHIHTSMAASIVKLIRAGKQDPEGGAAQVREHLRQAASSRFYNTYTSHVSASLLFDLANLDPAGIDSESAFANLVEAFQEIEKARQIIGARGHFDAKNRINFEMMADLEKRILASIPLTNTLKTLAQQMFDRTRNQAGFEVCARRLLVEASQDSKGKDFNEVNKYISECVDAINKAQAVMGVELLVIKIDLIIRWRIQSFASVQWEEFRNDLAQVVKNNRYRDDVIKTFYLGVAHFHCGETTEANAIFAMLRRWQPVAYGAREPRCYLLDNDGHPRRFQGTYKKEYQQWHFNVPELDVSVPSYGVPSYGAGAVAHAYIGFALNGPLALEHRPDRADYLLP
jgi:hypothetical protein